MGHHVGHALDDPHLLEGTRPAARLFLQHQPFLSAESLLSPQEPAGSPAVLQIKTLNPLPSSDATSILSFPLEQSSFKESSVLSVPFPCLSLLSPH